MNNYDLRAQFTRGFSKFGQFSRSLGFKVSRLGSDLVGLSNNDRISAGNGGLSRRPEPGPIASTHSQRPDYVFDPNAEHKADVQIFDGLMSLGDLIVWVGREKHRKSNLILQCAICIALGRKYLNFEFSLAKPARVVIFDYESKGASLKKRYDAICKGMGLTPEDRQLLRENLRIVDVRRSLKCEGSFPRFPANLKSAESKSADAFWAKIKKENPADVYVFDPMRSMHGEDENDSQIEKFLIRLRHFFGDAVVIVAHHMTKAGTGQYELRLKSDMRAWSDGARGSGAIKAHADVIVCQERVIENESEKVYWGAFLRDGADVEPIPLLETEPESFYWAVSREVPDHLRISHEALTKAGGKFYGKAETVEAIRRAVGTSRPTAYRHVTQMLNAGLLVVGETGDWLLKG